MVLDAVTQVDHAVAEPPLVHQLEIDADVVWEERIAATDDRPSDEQLVLIDQSGPDRLRCQVRTGDAEGKVGAGLQLPHGLRVERAPYPGPRAGDLVQRCGVDNLVRRLPDPRVPKADRPPVGRRVCGLPVDHRLVHSAAVEVRADRSAVLVDELV